MSCWYVEGQLADALLEAGETGEAKRVLEESIAAGNDIPFAHSLLVNLYLEAGTFADAYRIRRDSWRSSSERAQRNGMPALDPSIQIVGVAKWWKSTGSEVPLKYAETWAEEAKSRDAWLAVRHERGLFLEKQEHDAAALALYLDLIQQRTKHDATYTRAMVLLDRADREDETLALARTILGLGLSATLEERARKRIARDENKAVEVGAGSAKRGTKKPKAIVPAFSIRSGESSLAWIGQVEIKGGISSIVTTHDGALATGGTEPGLWWIANGNAEPARLRSTSKRTRVYCGRRSALVTDDGTVSNGSARIELLDDTWTTTASLDLPGVTSEVAVAAWGLAIGCRAGGLYALGWDGAPLWHFDMPEAEDSESSAFGRACPYLVSSVPERGHVVFSSYGDVYAVSEHGGKAWTWELPPPPAIVSGFLSIQMSASSVSAVQVTRDGGAWLASQNGDVYRLDGQGRNIWRGSVGANTATLITDQEDRLVAVGHSDGIALLNSSGTLTAVVGSKRWPRLVRSPDGLAYLATEGKLLHVLDAAGRVRAVVEFSRAISDAGFAGPRLVVAAGKLVTFDMNLDG